MIVDLFAGPGGWDTGAALLGIRDVLGVEWDGAACRTARAAGHTRLQADIAKLDPAEFHDVSGLIASPPCQSFSRAGQRKGIDEAPRLLALLDAVHARLLATRRPDDGAALALTAACWDDIAGHGDWADPRTPLVLEPLRWALELRPRWVAWEQVPDVLPLWQRMARILDDVGYSTATGVLSAERYGVPQTRRRAILVASLDGPASLPAATHEAYDPRSAGEDQGELFALDLDPWVSMAEALGWGLDDRPSWTVSAGGTENGGAEVFANAANRRELAEYVNGTRAHAARRSLDQPAPTVMFGHSANEVVWQFRDSGPGAERAPRPVSAPSCTIRAQGSGGHPAGVRWVQGNQRTRGQDGYHRREVDRPAPTITSGYRFAKWIYGRPATTVQGDPRIAPPGHRDREGGEAQFGEGTVRVTVEEAACLQSFPAGYPWRGSKSARYRQVGDAVPPLLAVAVLGSLLGVEGWRDICRRAYRPELLGVAA